MASNTDVVKKNYTITCLYYVLSLCLCVCLFAIIKTRFSNFPELLTLTQSLCYKSMIETPEQSSCFRHGSFVLTPSIPCYSGTFKHSGTSLRNLSRHFEISKAS